MKRIIYLGVVFFALAFAFGALNAQPSHQELDAMFTQGVSQYNSGNYAEAINIFKTIQGIDPSFRSSQIASRIRTANTRLGRGGQRQAYVPAQEDSIQVEVTKEDEMETFSMAAQRVLLDAYEYLSQKETRYGIPRFDMLEPQSTMRMAKSAYDKNQFAETIRLANKARLQMDTIVQKKADITRPVLGEIGDTIISRLELSNADLEETLKLIYDLTGANIILSRGIEGRVTINIKDLPLQRVLDLICEANRLKYLEEDGVIKIMTEEEYTTRAQAVREQNRRVFNVLYGDASLIAKSLRETFQIETIVHDPRTNSIIIDVHNPALLQQIQDIISSLDTPISQVLLEAKIVEISISEGAMFSIDWLVSSRLIDSLDTTLTGPRFGTPSFTPGLSTSLPSGFSFGLTNRDVNTLISALATKGEVKMIQAPKVMCLNGTTAIIRVVQNFPYIIPEYEQTFHPTTGAVTGTRQTVTIYEEEVGTEFEVTPIIQRNRTVFLTLNIYDSRLVEIKTLSAVAAGLEYQTEQPIISTRETTQNVTLFDGQTLVIGGMIQDREEKSETGVPFLRRIPVLGNLFRKPEYSKTSGELLMFITPYIITTYEEAEAVSRADIERTKREIAPGILERF